MLALIAALCFLLSLLNVTLGSVNLVTARPVLHRSALGHRACDCHPDALGATGVRRRMGIR